MGALDRLRRCHQYAQHCWCHRLLASGRSVALSTDNNSQNRQMFTLSCKASLRPPATAFLSICHACFLFSLAACSASCCLRGYSQSDTGPGIDGHWRGSRRVIELLRRAEVFPSEVSAASSPLPGICLHLALQRASSRFRQICDGTEAFLSLVFRNVKSRDALMSACLTCSCPTNLGPPQKWHRLHS